MTLLVLRADTEIGALVQTTRSVYTAPLVSRSLLSPYVRLRLPHAHTTISAPARSNFTVRGVRSSWQGNPDFSTLYVVRWTDYVGF